MPCLPFFRWLFSRFGLMPMLQEEPPLWAALLVVALSGCVLVILGVDLEVCLRVVAYGANVGGLGAYDDVAAVAALPP